MQNFVDAISKATVVLFRVNILNLKKIKVFALNRFVS